MTDNPTNLGNYMTADISVSEGDRRSLHRYAARLSVIDIVVPTGNIWPNEVRDRVIAARRSAR